MYAAVKQLAELQEKSEAAQKAAADEAARTTAAHTIELQKLQVERAKLEVGSLEGQPPCCALSHVYSASSRFLWVCIAAMSIAFSSWSTDTFCVC